MEQSLSKDEMLAIEYCLENHVVMLESKIETLTDDLANIGLKTDFLPQRNEIKLLQKISSKLKNMRLSS